MKPFSLVDNLRASIEQPMPVPGQGETAGRHLRLMELGREDLELARLAEAHWDAFAILAEAGRRPEPGAIYGVWASEMAGEPLVLRPAGEDFELTGTKRFCSGAGIVTHALTTVTEPQHCLIDIDLAQQTSCASFDETDWKIDAFSEIHTAKASFAGMRVRKDQLIGEDGWYLNRLGFWQGACGPAACWAGGGQALADYAVQQQHLDAHSLAHSGAMQAAAWSLRAALIHAGHQIDHEIDSPAKARVLALSLRHMIEQTCTDVLRRFTRAFGPRPLISDAKISRLYHQLDLYLRQSHAERDLEILGRDLHDQKAGVPSR